VRIRRPTHGSGGECVHPVLLDLALRVQPEVALDLDLDPEALAVESVLVALVEPLERLVALEDVLVRAAPEVMDAEAVGRVRRLRAVEEAPVGTAAIALPEPVEDPGLLPPGEDLLLEGGVIWILRQRLEHKVILGSLGRPPGFGTTGRFRALDHGYDR